VRDNRQRNEKNNLRHRIDQQALRIFRGEKLSASVRICHLALNSIQVENEENPSSKGNVMRKTGWLKVLFLSTFMVFCVQAQGGELRGNASATDAGRFARPEELSVLRGLSKQIELTANGTEFREVIDQISILSDLDILIKKQAFDEEGISTQDEVTLNLGAMSVWQTLHFLLKPRKLAWIVSDGVLEITTEFDSENVYITRTHDVRKLCKLLTPLTEEKFLRFRRAKPAPQAGMGGMIGMSGCAVFSVPADANVAVAVGQPGKEIDKTPIVQSNSDHNAPRSPELLLAHMICDHSSLHWEERDGALGTIAIGEGSLVITQTFQGHLEIAGLLHALERLIAGDSPGKSIVARKPGYPVEEDAKIHEILAKHKSLEIEEGPLEGIVYQLAEEAGFRLWFDREAMDEEGINPAEAELSQRRVRNLPLGIVLKKLLEQQNLTWIVEEGTLVITTNTQAARSMNIRFYDVGEPSRITCCEQLDGLNSILRRIVGESWDDDEAFASFVSPRHLVLRQSEQSYLVISQFVDDLVTKEQTFPIDLVFLELQVRAHTALDIEAASDLERVLPQLLESRWNKCGIIHRVGKSLVVKQPLPVHDEIEKIFTEFNDSHERRNPPATAPIDDQNNQPVMPNTLDDQVK
jgi:hypothetical protein